MQKSTSGARPVGPSSEEFEDYPVGLVASRESAGRRKSVGSRRTAAKSCVRWRARNSRKRVSGTRRWQMLRAGKAVIVDAMAGEAALVLRREAGKTVSQRRTRGASEVSFGNRARGRKRRGTVRALHGLAGSPRQESNIAPRTSRSWSRRRQPPSTWGPDCRKVVRRRNVGSLALTRFARRFGSRSAALTRRISARESADHAGALVESRLQKSVRSILLARSRSSKGGREPRVLARRGRSFMTKGSVVTSGDKGAENSAKT